PTSRLVSVQPTFHLRPLHSFPTRRSSDLGQAILHHLREKGQVARELYRVLKPRARAIFSEPFGNSSLLERLRLVVPVPKGSLKIDRKSTRLNSSHGSISYAVFCLKKKKMH